MPENLELLVGDGALNDIWEASFIITEAANIRFGTNPSYSISDFLGVYPQFGPADYSEDGDDLVWVIPEAVIQMYINLASASLSWERWQDTWEVAMAFYVAHYLTIYSQSMGSAGSSAKTLARLGVAKGIQVSKSVSDLSTSYQSIVSGWESWGDWNLTLFGQQLMHFARIIGMGPVYVW